MDKDKFVNPLAIGLQLSQARRLPDLTLELDQLTKAKEDTGKQPSRRKHGRTLIKLREEQGIRTAI